MNFHPIKKVLQSLITTLKPLTLDEFTSPIKSLSNATIGEHTRHIIELFQCVLIAYNEGIVNYDDRKRNQLMQNNLDTALEQLQILCESIEKDNIPLKLKTSESQNNEFIETNYYREILYNFEHCIHHQALIKVGLLALNKTPNSHEFGVAPSTIAYKKICAQ